MISPCCNVEIGWRKRGKVIIGSCERCGRSLMRMNPEIGIPEWLDGKNPNANERFKPVQFWRLEKD